MNRIPTHPQLKLLLVISVVLIYFFATTSADSDGDNDMLSVRAWQAVAPAGGLSAADFPESQFVQHKPNTAVGFSGGGSRAYVASLGYLAALRDLDLLKSVRYMGGISGGSWATSTFVFTQQSEVSDDTLLGPVQQPEDITLDSLQEMDPHCARGFARDGIITNGLYALEQQLVDSVAGAWCYGVSALYLEPVGITKETRFSWNEQTVLEIKERNPQLAGEKFLTPLAEKDRPFPILGTSIVGPSEGAPYPTFAQNYTMIEFTPLYVGQMRAIDVQYDRRGSSSDTLTRRVGGAVEPFSFAKSSSGGGDEEVTAGATDCIPAGESTALLSVAAPAAEAVLDLQYAAGASSYATGAFFDSLPQELAERLSLEFDYWSPTTIDASATGDTDAEERTEEASSSPVVTRMMFTDGGCYENIPLINFMQRRVPKIVLFFMSSVPLQPFENWNVTADAYSDDQVTNDLSAFFGALCTGCEQRWENVSYEYEQNQVFPTGDYATVITTLQAKQQEGKGIVATFNLTTVENKWWGIPAGLQFEITFSYLGRLPQWEGRLSDEMYDLVVPKENSQDLSHDREDGPFSGFPHYATMGGGIDHQRANLLADLTAWSVLQNADEFQRMLS